MKTLLEVKLGTGIIIICLAACATVTAIYKPEMLDKLVEVLMALGGFIGIKRAGEKSNGAGA